MGKRFKKVNLWNISDEEKVKRGEIKPIEVEAQIDNGATSVVLPETIADELKLPVFRQTYVKYANEKMEIKDVVGGLRIEILGRSTVCEAIVGPQRKTGARRTVRT